MVAKGKKEICPIDCLTRLTLSILLFKADVHIQNMSVKVNKDTQASRPHGPAAVSKLPFAWST
jgi:hypothetical protein